MKVLFYGDYQNRVGGAQNSLLAAVQRIGAFGIEGVIVFPGPGPFVEIAKKRGVDVRIVEGPESFQTFGKKLLRLGPKDLLRVATRELAPYWRRLANFAGEMGAEAMHFNTPRGLLMAGPAAQLARLGSVFHQRGTPALGPTIKFLSQVIPDRIVIVSKTVFDYLAPSVHPRTRLVYNGIDPAPPIPFADARRDLLGRLAEQGIRVGSDEKVFLSLSAMVPFKGIHHLVDAAKRAADRGVKAHYILASGAGEDDYTAFIRERVAGYGLDKHVHLVGYVADTHRALSGSDALLLTSIVHHESVTFASTAFPEKTVHLAGCEGLPRSILESLAAGTPTIATDGGGVREQIDEGVTGYIVPPADPGALADAILKIARDPEACARSRSVGPEVVRQRFSLEGAARGLADTLREVRSGPRIHYRLPGALSLLADGVRDVAKQRRWERAATLPNAST